MTMTATITRAEDMIDLCRYPIGDITSAAGRAFADQCREEYARSGLCILPGFIMAHALEILAQEAAVRSGAAYFYEGTHNAYLDENDSNRREQTFVGSIAYDLLGESSRLRRLYLWDPLKDFIGHVLGKDTFFRFSDPLGACSVNVFVDGGEHGWHFDESEFTVTLMLQSPESGGGFEYAPRIRGLKDEEAIVGRILDGDRNGVMELPFTAGTLLIFGGNQTLHRVTRVSGERPRLVPVLCYSELPDQKNSDAVRKMFWGRTGREGEAVT